jgi:hypothetical protein
MAAKRKRRFGTIRELPSGRWQARYRGDWLMRSVPHTFSREREADQWLTVVESELLRRLDRSVALGSDVGRVRRRWIKERTLKPRTRDDYEGMFRNYVELHLGSVAVCDIGTATVRQWRTRLLDGGMSGNRAAKVYRLLRAILYTAVDDGMIKRNPCRIKGADKETSTPDRSRRSGTARRNQTPAAGGLLSQR